MHEVAGDDGALSARADIDAAMTWRMARGRSEPQSIVELISVVHQQRLAVRDHRFAVIWPYIARRRIAAFRRFLTGGVFARMEHVFRLREGRDPLVIAQHGDPTEMVDM